VIEVGSGEAYARGCITGQVTAVGQAYYGSGYTVATGVQVTQYGDGERGVTVGQVAEARTADGYNLAGRVEREVGTPGHETVQATDYREDVHNTAYGRHIDGIVHQVTEAAGHVEQHDVAFQADLTGSAATGYHLADLHVESITTDHPVDPGVHDHHNGIV
jgi:hypothetical protein